jgi:hypothetical protein
MPAPSSAEPASSNASLIVSMVQVIEFAVSIGSPRPVITPTARCPPIETTAPTTQSRVPAPMICAPNDAKGCRRPKAFRTKAAVTIRDRNPMIAALV